MYDGRNRKEGRKEGMEDGGSREINEEEIGRKEGRK